MVDWKAACLLLFLSYIWILRSWWQRNNDSSSLVFQHWK